MVLLSEAAYTDSKCRVERVSFLTMKLTLGSIITRTFGAEKLKTSNKKTAEFNGTKSVKILNFS